MNNRWFYITATAVVLVLNVYPLYQLDVMQGHLFYMNAYDESSYLQYDFSRANQNFTRGAQYLVTLGHELGLSGGRINLLFDLAALPVFLIFSAKCFRLIGFDKRTSNLHALLLTVLPLSFCGFNPIVRFLFEWTLATGNITWLTTPEAIFLPFVRTPEPQFSLAILSMVVYWSLKKRSFWYLYPVLPFLYPFVGVPSALIAVSLHLRYLFPERMRGLMQPVLVSYLLVGAGVWFFTSFLISNVTRNFLVQTRAPLVSLTAVECLLVLIWGYRRCEAQYRPLLVSVAVTPLLVANLQILSGYLGSPNAFEQYFGTLCASFVLVMSIGPLSQKKYSETGTAFLDKRRLNYRSLKQTAATLFEPQPLRRGLFVLCLGLVFLSGRLTFRENYAVNASLPLTEDVLSALRTRSERVAIDNQRLASVTNMIYPRQPSTLLGYERSYSALCNEDNFREYLAAKNSILANEEVAERYREMLNNLDRAYQYEGADFILIHIGRKTEFLRKNDPSAIPEEIDADEPVYVFTNRQKPPKPRYAILKWMKQAVARPGGTKYD